MKNATVRPAPALAEVLDIHEPEQAARLSQAFARERDRVQAALAELVGLGYADRLSREVMALTTMEPLPGHGLMERAPREVLRLRAALHLIDCHEHRRN